MTPSTYPISMSQVAAEVGTALPLAMLDSRVRALAGSSGAVSMGGLLGKSAMSAIGNNASGSSDSSTAGGSVSTTPSVTVTGGAAPLTYSWSFTSNPSTMTLSAATGAPNCVVSKTYARHASFSISCILQCVITDANGASVTVSGVIGELNVFDGGA